MAGKFSALDMLGTQFNRLASDGTILHRTDTGDHGGRNVVLTCGLVDITRQENVGEERTVRDPNGQGGYCAERIAPAGVQGYTYTLTLCSAVDPELMELLDLVDRVIDPGTSDTVGFKAKDLSTINCSAEPAASDHHGVSFLAWSLAWDGAEQKATYPYVVEVAPKVRFNPGYSRQKSTQFNTVQLTGETETNASYGQGPDGAIYPEVAGLDRHWAEVITATAWPGGCNCAACDGYVDSGGTPDPLPLES